MSDAARPAFGLLVVTHGRLAHELVQAVTTIVGEVDGLEAVSIGWNVEVDEARGTIAEAAARAGGGGPTIVLTDMFGGTPSNLALALLEPGRLEVITGVNLPMLVKAVTLRGEASLTEAARRIAEQGRQSIQVAAELLAARRPREGE